jgi:UDPglucose--hexose-1-phosphate uridylyltransferase
LFAKITIVDLRDFNQIPHRRFNPLKGDWVLVSPHRNERPWQGSVEKQTSDAQPQYDPNCYLCPGNARAGGARNPDYGSTFVFTNDFAALRPEVPAARIDQGQRGLLVSETEAGICKVVCFSPRHDLTLPRMSVSEIKTIVDTWIEEYTELGAQSAINHVQIFENRGEMMGCSNPHPHSQIWANQTIPDEPRVEQERQLAYKAKHKTCMLCDYVKLEQEAGQRVICENVSFLALVPFWAVWPFEVLLISKTHVPDITSLDNPTRIELADILKRISTRYDNLFEIPFPYSMGFHQAPTDGKAHPEWHFHAHFYPPLLRSATVRKFMVGYEMLASPQRDLTPELAAARLREAREVHYLDRVLLL